MSWNRVRLEDVKPVPWRNGGGVTRELLAWPDGAHWKLRMSVAEVAQDGPFSRFDGVERWFAVLAGAGVRLRLDGATHELTTGSAPFRFDGGATTDCAPVAGPTQDFNLMLQGGHGRMQRVRGALAVACRAGQLVAVYGGAAGARVDVGNEQLETGSQTLAWRILDADGALRIEAPDALWMEIEP